MGECITKVTNNCITPTINQVGFVNNGGDGRFRLISEDLWLSAAAAAVGPGSAWEAAAAWGANPEAAARSALAPFWIEPPLLELPAGAAGSLAVEFAPTAVGEEERTFVLVGDNCRVWRYKVRGRGTEVDVRLEEEDGRPVAGATGLAEAAGERAQPPPIWLGDVVPGARAARMLRVHNATPLPLPFVWEVGRLDGGGSSGDSSSNQQASAAFRLEPPSGVLQPGERLQVAISFTPSAVGAVAAQARLVVDRSTSARRPGIIGPARKEEEAAAAAALQASLAAAVVTTGGVPAAAQLAANAEGSWESTESEEQPRADHQQEGSRLVVADLLLQGSGAPAELQLDPPFVRLPGLLTCGQRATAPILLRNPTAAPVEFQFTTSPAESGEAGAVDGSVTLVPSSGTVPPGGSLLVTAVLQPSVSGPLRRTLACAVKHGQSQQLVVSAAVQEAEVAVATASQPRDLGLVRIGHSAAIDLQLVNRSPFGPAVWSLEQMLVVGEDGLTQQQQLQLEPSSGQPPPSGTCSVRISCLAAVPGRHRLTLRLRSGAGAHESYVEVLATVVVPDVCLEPCR
jgi:hypothetical protein